MRGRGVLARSLIAAVVAIGAACGAQAQSRIKDIASLQGVRDNQLVGYGLVVGLNGTGDSLRNSVFTEQSLQSMLDRMGVSVRNGTLRTRNVAAVIITADLPAFAGRGSRVDVTVSSLGDATSLMGGTLVITPMAGVDGVTYAVAQGQVAVTGFQTVGQAETVTQGVPTAARIANGAIIERELPGRFADMGAMVLELRNPDFKTAVEVADAINAYTQRRYGQRTATERDYRSVVLNRPAKVMPTRFMAEIGDLTVMPDVPARVVVDARSGTVVIGQDVQISTVAVTHGNLTVRVTETPTVSQPKPFSSGETVVTPQTSIGIEQEPGNIAVVGGTTLKSLVRGLNQMGLKPTGIIAILQAIKSAGALQADLVVQ
ncbi:MAG: flagellar basal body P-ring protein FlgI [Beijerinckiaceae bacterium]|nr:flagellar basal body P-ring protein FlgI [Beijerinckiaceae bacterium]MDO9441302.1 flagellar basal body P-ring protein FlgI [Beijerinckiaceae bacterium]